MFKVYLEGPVVVVVTAAFESLFFFIVVIVDIDDVVGIAIEWNSQQEQKQGEEKVRPSQPTRRRKRRIVRRIRTIVVFGFIWYDVFVVGVIVDETTATAEDAPFVVVAIDGASSSSNKRCKQRGCCGICCFVGSAFVAGDVFWASRRKRTGPRARDHEVGMRRRLRRRILPRVPSRTRDADIRSQRHRRRICRFLVRERHARAWNSQISKR